MAKRFTDTEKWRKPFIKNLSTTHKVVWFYILDECDHAGIWEVEEEVMSARIHEKVDLYEFLSAVGDKIKVIEDGRKWFIQDFVDFQYGILSPLNRMHTSVIHRLEKYNLMKNKPLTSPLEGAKDKGTDKVKDKDKGTAMICGDCLRSFDNHLAFKSHLAVCGEVNNAKVA